MSVRPYRGVEAADRVAQRRGQLLAAGLDILGSAHADALRASAHRPDLSALTVRGICRQAAVAARYFYESFTDKDAFIGAVFDWVIADLAATTQAAVAAAPQHEQTRAGITNIVATIADDARVGRLLFSAHLADAVLMRKRVESGALFAMLSGRHVGSALHVAENDRIKATAHFVVGGVGQTISAWLAGGIALDPDQLVDQLVSIIDDLADPELFRS